MATMEDIARELSLSKSTVSKALSGARDVSHITRQAVLEKAVELGYSRFPRGGEPSRIALFLINMDYRKPEDFGYDIVVGFRKAAQGAGFEVEIIDLDRNTQTSMGYEEYMVLHQYCGALFLGLSLLDPWLKDFETCKTPTVLYDNHISGNPNVTHIGVDNAEAMGLAVSYLKSLGHTRIGYLSSALEAYVYQLRYHAFFRAMREHRLPVNTEQAGNALYVSVCLSEHLPRLLEMGCTAIMCSHDVLAHSVMIHCAELGLRVPEDISILGFDDIPLCRYTSPALSTIRQDRAAIGKSAFFALTNQFNKIPLSTFLLHAQLVQRESCTRVHAPSDSSDPTFVRKPY